MAIALDALPRTSEATDAELVDQVKAGAKAPFAVLIRRYNQRLYRVARSITNDPDEAEDVVQEALLSAYQHLAGFEGRAQFSTWLTQIAINAALARVRKRKRLVLVDEPSRREPSGDPGPAAEVARRELAVHLESAIALLEPHYRLVYVLREIEELSTAETAALTSLSPEAVRVRLHRARAVLRETLLSRFGVAATDVFEFAGARCDRMVGRVFAALEPGAAES